MSNPTGTRLLQQLAHLYGVQTAYYDLSRLRRTASRESLLAVLRSLGAPISTLQDVPLALREQRQTLWQRPTEPVEVAWEGVPFAMEIRLPFNMADAALRGRITLESSEERELEWDAACLPVKRYAEVEGVRYVAKGLSLPEGLPQGYHRLTLEMPKGPAQTLVIAAPPRAYTGSQEGGARGWGAFLPLYALRTTRSWGSGDLSDLEALMMWVGEMGNALVGTLPLLASFLEEPFDPSPYAPVSRLFWNELYLDVTRAPELERCPLAQALMESSPLWLELTALREAPLVDYRGQMVLKRRVLELLVQCFFAEPSPLQDTLWRFVEGNPMMDDYARFRATLEKRCEPWKTWPEPLRQGKLTEGDYDEGARLYYLYVQWLAHQQMKAIAASAREKNVKLYLDLPLGVNPDGYDTWREQELFVHDASTGAPPDSFFTRGQNWGFPPLHPGRLREQGYCYFIASLRHHLRHAGALRLDHVMGLHRLFWVPEDMDPNHGVYVRYSAEEFYAILALESHRSRALIVGEDLGIVPPEVRSAMARHGVYRMYVVQYELMPPPKKALRKGPRHSVASLNTHDMPTFSAFWQGLDIPDRQNLGLLNREDARREWERRQALKRNLVNFLRRKGFIQGPDSDPKDVLNAILLFLSASPARIVLVNLEDLWLETQPQNVPGTLEERPNWRRKARFSLEELRHMQKAAGTLQAIVNLRT